MKNYSRKFRRNRKGGFWPFDNNTQPAAPSNNGMINNVENQATNAFTTVKDGATTAFTNARDKSKSAFSSLTGMFSNSNPSDQNQSAYNQNQYGGRRSRRRRSRKNTRRR